VYIADLKHFTKFAAFHGLADCHTRLCLRRLSLEIARNAAADDVHLPILAAFDMKASIDCIVLCLNEF